MNNQDQKRAAFLAALNTLRQLFHDWRSDLQHDLDEADIVSVLTPRP